MTHPQKHLTDAPGSLGWKVAPSRFRWGLAVGSLAVVLALASCTVPAASEEAAPGGVADEQASASEPATASDGGSTAEPVENTQEESCDWNSPRITGSVDTPQEHGLELSEVLVGAWQHTHTDEGSGFEEVPNDHRFVFPASDRLLYCQHVPGATEYAENAADVTLSDTTIELPGGKYGYTVTAWDEDTMLWDNPVGGGYVYLLQRR
ncbi:hypothetical protein [Microbacterium sp. A82]|uniref:hypothetical protein n=1 Tax=Microbacterium sp. A82 TaxID=3450452 RepID=UPI003F62AA8B